MNINIKEVLSIGILVICLGILGLFSEVVFAADFDISDQISCESLPGSTIWDASSSECSINSDHTIDPNDTLTIQSPVRTRAMAASKVVGSATVSPDSSALPSGAT